MGRSGVVVRPLGNGGYVVRVDVVVPSLRVALALSRIAHSFETSVDRVRRPGKVAGR